MTKGPLALVLCGLAMGLAIAMSADIRRRLLDLHWIAGLGLAVAISAPWFVYMYLRFRGDFVAGYVLDENIRLYATERFGDQPPFWFYFQLIATGMLPWTGVVIGRFVDDVRAAMSHWRGTSRGDLTVLRYRRDALGLDHRRRRFLHVLEIQARSLRVSRCAGALSADCARMG